MLSVQSPVVAPGGEIQSLCQSWTLDNDQPLYVQSAVLNSGHGFHHGNWFYVRDSDFPGPDAVWPCAERNFDTVSGTVSGGIFVGQSTQSTSDTAVLPAGAAVQIPPHSRIIADVHLLNASDVAIAPAMELTLEFSPASAVAHQLHILGITYQDLELPPNMMSEFSTECDVNDFYVSKTGHTADFSAYYALPHYHSRGTFARAELVGGPNDGTIVFKTDKKTGEPWGQTLSPPVSMAGASGLRVTCGFSNNTDKPIKWGYGDGEMCLVGLMTDSPFRMAGAALRTTSTEVIDGVSKSSGPCVFVGL